MTVDVGRTFREAFDMTVSRAGISIMALYLVFQVLNLVVSQSFFMAALPASWTMSSAYPLAVEMSAAVSGIAWLLLLLAGAALGLGVIRTFVNERTESLPVEYFTSDLLMPLVNIFIGGILFSIAVMVGFVLFVIPGIFLMVSLIFWIVYVAVEDQNFMEAFSSSWQLAKENRFPLFAIGLLMMVATYVFTLLFSVPSSLLLGRAASSMAVMIPSAIISVFNVAALASAYNQLSG
ncbi:MAG: hypothetical protein ABEJ07_00050 [Candidatus Nanohaloarchaea archaeon]